MDEVVLTVLSIAIGGLVIYKVLQKWSDIWYGRIKGLPPGTMGWPLLGENASLLKHGPDFISKRRLRYGDMFKTNLLGGPTVVCTDPDTIKYILTHESHDGGFLPGYPPALITILGQGNFANLIGTQHKATRGALMSLISGSVMKEQLLPKINQFMQSFLPSWNSRVLDLEHKCNEVVMLLTLKMLASAEESSSFTKELQKVMHRIFHGCFSPPINLPGTSFYKALEARRKVVKMLGEMVEERKDSACRKNDILDAFLNSQDCNNNMIKLSDDEPIVDFVINFIFASLDVVSGVMMMAVKYLHDHPDALQELRKENQEIQKGKPKDYMIRWTDYKSMTFTRAVILETLRMSTPAPGIMRKTTADTRIKGHLIPKGWRIFLYTRDISYDPDIYPDPFNFNPWRWLESNSESRQYFLMYGDGGRLCAGKELSILEISIFLHYLVTTYCWEEIGESKIVNFPRLEAPNGMHFRFSAL